MSNEAWANHLLRNDSVFVDLFHGQLKSRLQCPRCDQVGEQVLAAYVFLLFMLGVNLSLT